MPYQPDMPPIYYPGSSRIDTVLGRDCTKGEAKVSGLLTTMGRCIPYTIGGRVENRRHLPYRSIELLEVPHLPKAFNLVLRENTDERGRAA